MLHDTYRREEANTNVRVRTSGIRRIAHCTACTNIITTTTIITNIREYTRLIYANDVALPRT